MSSSATSLPTFQALASNIYNADKTTPIYNGGWDFKNASAVTTFAVSAAGAVTIGPSSQIVNPLTVNSSGVSGGNFFTASGVYGGSVGSLYNTGGMIIAQNAYATSVASDSWAARTGGAGIRSNAIYMGANNSSNAFEFRHSADNPSTSGAAFATLFPNLFASCTTAGAWTLGPTGFTGTHTIRGGVNFTGTGIIVLSSNVISSGAGTHYVKWNSSTGILTYDTSSRLVKTDIVDCPYGLDTIMQLSPRKYLRTDDPKSEVGFIADEVVGVIPEIVPMMQKSLLTKNEADTEQIPGGVNYDRLTAVLVKAIQEQQAMIEELKAKIAALELRG